MSFYQIVIVVLMIAGILSYNKVVQYTRGGYENYPQIPRSQKQACPMDCKQYAVP